MARKVFISFLGTNNYLQTHYDFGNGEISRPVRFVQEALISSICKDWTENDRIYIFCTKDALKMNWEDNGHARFNEKEEKDQKIEKIGLKRRLKENFNLYHLVEQVDINEGFTEKDIWIIFDCVYDKLQLKDEIYFDVTHAFRSIPLFSTVLFNYSRFMKDTNVVLINYGAFEKLGPVREVREIPIAERVAPIIDLTNIVRLQQYTDMASSMVTFGRIKHISKMLKTENNTASPIIEQLSKSIEDFDNSLLANRMNEIKSGKSIIAIRNNIKALRKLDIPNPIKKVIGRLDSEIKDFVAEDSNKNIEAAIEWAVKYKMLPQAYTLGQEYIISLLCEQMKDKNPFTDKKKTENRRNFRMYLSSLCSISEDDIKEENFREPLSLHLKLTRELLKDETILNLRPDYSELGEKRNAVNHAKGNVTYRELEEEFYSLYHKCLSSINPSPCS